MSDRYEVHPVVLSRSAQDWRDQSARVRTAGDRLADASTSGFAPRVAAAAASWTATWGTTVRTVASDADTVADELLAAALAFGTVDREAHDAWDAWLDGAP